MIDKFLSGECCVLITKEDLPILGEFVKAVGDIKWADGRKFNSSLVYDLANRYEKVWVGYSDEVTFSTHGSWKEYEYPVCDFKQRSIEITEEEIIGLMGD